MAAPFPNIYTHRKVADTAAKACDICYKTSTSVLITPDQKDFFFVCAIHLTDINFCTPRIDHEAIKAKRERELAAEVEKVKKEYEERQRLKKEKAAKASEKDKVKGEESEKEKEKGQKEKDSTAAGNEAKGGQEDKGEADSSEQEQPRIFELKSTFYQQRLLKKRQLEAAKKDRERASKPNYFPSVPTNLPGKR